MPERKVDSMPRKCSQSKSSLICFSWKKSFTNSRVGILGSKTVPAESMGSFPWLRNSTVPLVGNSTYFAFAKYLVARAVRDLFLWRMRLAVYIFIINSNHQL